MKKNNKGLVIFGLLALCVILTAGIFLLGQSPKGEDNSNDAGEVINDVTPGEIDGDTALKDPEINPEPITTPEPSADEPSGNDIPLTVIEEKPEPPEKPDTTQTDEPHEPPTDPALTNPDKKPDTSPKPAETTPPKDTTPQAGDKDGKGNVYIPGFGWVKDEGGGGQGEKSELDPEHSDFDNIIGH